MIKGPTRMGCRHFNWKISIICFTLPSASFCSARSDPYPHHPFALFYLADHNEAGVSTEHTQRQPTRGTARDCLLIMCSGPSFLSFMMHATDVFRAKVLYDVY